MIVSYELREDNLAYVYYEKALSIDPFATIGNKQSTMRMADIYIQEKNFREAKKLLNSLLELNPSVKNDHRFIKLQKLCEDPELQSW